MPLTPFPIDQFAGLDLYNDPEEIGSSSAVDLLNIDLNQRGRLRTRDGSTALTAAASSPVVRAMTYSKAGGVNEMVVALIGVTTVTPYALSNGAALTTQTATPTSNNAFAQFGDPSNIRLYMAAGTLYRYDGTSWTTVTAPINPTLAAVTANDNRLAICDGTTIHWSDAGAPETFGSSNKIQLWPGDSESVTALIRWRDLLFAFKQSKFAVFTGTGLLSDGSPEFLYRSVDAGHGAYAVGSAVAGDEGVYFADANGVYLTAGGPPRYISRQLEPWIAAGSFGNLPNFTLASSILVYHNRRLYVTYLNGASAVTLVYDPALDAWMVWQIGASGMCSVPTSSSINGLYFGEFTSKKIAKVDSTATTDLGTAITWRYQTGYSSAGGYFRARIVSSGERKKHFKTDIFGSGTVTHQVLALNARANDVADPGASVTLGTSPAVARGSRRRGVRGTYFAHKLSGTGPATINGLTYWLSEIGQDT